MPRGFDRLADLLFGKDRAVVDVKFFVDRGRDPSAEQLSVEIAEMLKESMKIEPVDRIDDELSKR